MVVREHLPEYADQYPEDQEEDQPELSLEVVVYVPLGSILEVGDDLREDPLDREVDPLEEELLLVLELLSQVYQGVLF